MYLGFFIYFLDLQILQGVFLEAFKSGQKLKLVHCA